jgi:hypothetical protein
VKAKKMGMIVIIMRWERIMGLSEFLEDSGIFFMLSCAIVYH